MPRSSNETDLPTVEQEVPAIIDQNIRLLCHFTAIPGDVLILQIYTRKWHDFLDNRVINAHLPGKLGRLPPEIRFVIYDYMMPANENRFYLQGTSGRWWSPCLFAVPNNIAHVCRDMRQYAMSKYQFIWYKHTTLIVAERLKTVPGFIPNVLSDEPAGEICMTRYREKIHKVERSRFGFFDPKKDSIEIHLSSVRAVQLVEAATVEWDNAFQEPALTNLSTRVKQYSPKEANKIFVFTPKESGVWQRFWAAEWVKNQEPPVLV
ncbi:hypothetical protein EV127DRAFT_438452 [Xylaria flabelliformis]|nr:hypothetical protein EV127DRAFT_438452 [Xylaria flabelliformis]